MIDETSKVLAAREAGAVERCHTFPHHGKYTVGEHCYNVVSLLLILNPEPSMELVKSCLWHDTAERFLGDLPATTKWEYKTLATTYKSAEDSILLDLGFNFDLSDEELCWLHALDKLELLLWAYHQKHIGNQYADILISNIEKWFAANTIPDKVSYFINKYLHHRLPDDYHVSFTR